MRLVSRQILLYCVRPSAAGPAYQILISAPGTSLAISSPNLLRSLTWILRSAKKSLELTNAWAKRCIDAKKSKQSLFGIVQGSQFRDLRVRSAEFISSLAGFDGFGIGGDLGESKTGSKQILDWVIPHLDGKKPRHLLGIGQIEDIEIIVRGGIDLFDCTVPMHYARRGIAFTDKGRVDFNKAQLLKDKGPIDPACDCLVCMQYQRDYVAHLIRAKEITGGALLTFHNLFFFNTYVERVREKIRRDKL